MCPDTSRGRVSGVCEVGAALVPAAAAGAQALVSFGRLSYPACVMRCAESWGFTIMTLAAGAPGTARHRPGGTPAGRRIRTAFPRYPVALSLLFKKVS